MNYFFVEPEVAGGLGPDSVLDRATHPPVVKRLQYQFDGWLGDELLETFPAFIVTNRARQLIDQSGLSGAQFGEVEVSRSPQFEQLYPGRELPGFVWLQIIGIPRQDDFGTSADGRLVVSETALKLLRSIGISNAFVTPF